MLAQKVFQSILANGSLFSSCHRENSFSIYSLTWHSRLYILTKMWSAQEHLTPLLRKLNNGGLWRRNLKWPFGKEIDASFRILFALMSNPKWSWPITSDGNAPVASLSQFSDWSKKKTLQLFQGTAFRIVVRDGASRTGPTFWSHCWNPLQTELNYLWGVPPRA